MKEGIYQQYFHRSRPAIVCQPAFRSSTFNLLLYIFVCFFHLFIYFVGKDVKLWFWQKNTKKRRFWLVNSIQSTCWLVKVHNIQDVDSTSKKEIILWMMFGVLSQNCDWVFSFLSLSLGVKILIELTLEQNTHTHTHTLTHTHTQCCSSLH